MSTKTIPAATEARVSARPEIREADPAYLHAIFENRGGFERFQQILGLRDRAARLIWERPGRTQANRRNRHYLTLSHTLIISHELGIDWADLIAGLHGLQRSAA